MRGNQFFLKRNSIPVSSTHWPLRSLVGAAGAEEGTETAGGCPDIATGGDGNRSLTFLPQPASTRAARVASAAASRRRRRELTKSGVEHLGRTFLPPEALDSLQRRRDEAGASI